MRKRTLMALLAALALTGCAQTSSLYLQADRATYDAVAPEYLDYVAADESLSPEDVNTREATITSWRKRVEAHEADAADAAK